MTNMQFVKSKENLIMIAIRKVAMLSLVLAVAACGNDGQPPQEGQPPSAVQPDRPGRLNLAADQKARIYLPTTVDTKAEPVYFPPFPDHDDLNFDGLTVIQIVIGTNGIVETAFVEGTSGRVSVDSLMLDMVRKTVWKPAIHDGAPVEMRLSFPIRHKKWLQTPGEETVTEE